MFKTCGITTPFITDQKMTVSHKVHTLNHLHIKIIRIIKHNNILSYINKNSLSLLISSEFCVLPF